MFRYALKRLVRGKSLFLTLFLSVLLAATLFSGILQASDTVGASMLNKALEATDVDIVSSAEDRNLTRTSLAEVKDEIAEIEHVSRVEWLFRSIQMGPGEGIEVNVTGVNTSMPFTIVAVKKDSSLIEGILGIDELEYGKVYVEAGSINASLFREGDPATLSVQTYIPGGSVLLFERRYQTFTVGSLVELDTRFFSIAMGRYSVFLRSLLAGTGEIGKRPEHKLIILSEETFLDWMYQIYGEWRRHCRVIIAETVIGLDRGRLLNLWSLSNSARNVQQVFDQINSLGARYEYIPKNYLGDLLDSVETIASQMRTNTVLIATPVFFMAWYLGLTVSDISLGLRRREIGLLFTRGLTHRQVFYIFLFEAFVVSILAGASGILLSAMILPTFIPGISATDVVTSISPVTLAVSITFSCILALIAVYKPAQNALKFSIVDALREYQSEEEETGTWHEPVLALSLGLYRVVMLVLNLTVEQFRPEQASLVVNILYSTWWGVDYILSYLAPVLLFWGFTNLFVKYFPWFHEALGKLAGYLVGDIALFSTLSVRRNLKRTVASTFMAALILGYGFSVIGGLASTDEYSERFTRLTIGADASVWLFEGDEADAIKDMILEVDGVSAVTVETWFEAESNIGDVPIRIIDPLEFKEVAYIEEGWLSDEDAFERMNESEYNAILEKGIAEIMNVPKESNWIIKVGTKVHSFSVVGFYGREPGSGWMPQNPSLYIPNTYFIKPKYLGLTRILVRFEDSPDLTGMKERLEDLHPDIEGVDIANNLIEKSSTNIFLVGPRRVGELGVYFAALVSSFGVAIVVWTTMRSRWKEITVMAIRGFSNAQLAITLLTENLGMILFSVTIGVGVGFVMMKGETEVYNASVPSVLPRHTVFPQWAQVTMLGVIGLLVLSSVIPILLAVRRASNNPTWRIKE